MVGKKERLKDLYEKVDKVQPFAEKDGQVYVSFEDAAVLNSYNADEPRTGLQTRNRDGSLASTGKTVHALNTEYFFSNRYKLKGSGANRKMYVVSGHEPTGYRCIKEQSGGRLFVKSVPAYIFSRDAEGRLQIEALTTVSDIEFISDFTKTLDNQSMAELLPLITKYGSDMTADSMPI